MIYDNFIWITHVEVAAAYFVHGLLPIVISMCGICELYMGSETNIMTAIVPFCYTMSCAIAR